MTKPSNGPHDGRRSKRRSSSRAGGGATSISARSRAHRETRALLEKNAEMAHSLLRSQVVAAFGEDPGALPDGVVVGSTHSDWVRVMELIAEVRWDAAWTSDGRPVALSDLDDPARASESFALRPASGVQINFFPGGPEVLATTPRQATSH